MSEEPIYTYRITRRVDTGGSGLAAGCSILFGLVFLLIFPPLGIVLLLAGIFGGATYKLVSTCGHCGNKVAHTRTLCPTCHADLAPEPRKKWFRWF